MKRIKPASTAALIALALLAPMLGWANEEDPMPLGMTTRHLNIVLAVTDADKTHQFYGKVLGLRRIPPLHLPGDVEMIRYMGGKSEIKLIVNGKPLPKFPGGTATARGIRLMTILLPDSERDGVLERLESHGHPRPEFRRPEGAAFEYGFVRDPDDNEIELVFLDAGTPESIFDRFQIGLTVSDTDAMRVFLRAVLELKELEPEPIEGGPMKYSFQVGTSTIKFWSGDSDLPAVVGGPFDGIGYRLVQFLVSDVGAVRDLIVCRGGTFAKGPFALGKLATILFVEGPDGIYFEFAGPLFAR